MNKNFHIFYYYNVKNYILYVKNQVSDTHSLASTSLQVFTMERKSPGFRTAYLEKDNEFPPFNATPLYSTQLL